MGRESIGASFSVCREPSLALASEKWGLQSQEGIGAMGTYIVGTIIGALFFSFLGSIFASLNIFHPYALGMASGGEQFDHHLHGNVYVHLSGHSPDRTSLQQAGAKIGSQTQDKEKDHGYREKTSTPIQYC